MSKNGNKRKYDEYNNNPNDDGNDGNGGNGDDNMNVDVWDKYKFSEDEKKTLERRCKRVKIKHPTVNASGWVSATKTKYFLLNDKCLDWLMMYYDKIGINPDPVFSASKSGTNIIARKTNPAHTKADQVSGEKLLRDASHMEVLFDSGNMFEEKVFEELKDIYKDNFKLVFTKTDYDKFKGEKDMNGFIRQKYNETIDLMKKSTPIIAQAVMINDSNRTYGVADLLVRSDYFNLIYEYFPDDDSLTHQAPSLGFNNTQKYHYRVVDCKWTTMTLCVDGVTIRNEGYFPAYKGQLAVYTGCLEQMQGYIPNCAYIMSKAWKIGKSFILKEEEHLYKGFSCFDRVGIINYGDKDKNYVETTKEAVQWVQRVMTDGIDWRYGSTTPSVPEMYPNMDKNFNPVFDKVKKELAERYGEITQVWYVNYKNRLTAHENGVTDIRDDKMSLDVLGIKPEGRGRIIQKIIEINKKSQKKDVLRPAIIQDNSFDWQTGNEYLDYYVDFETINYNLYSKPTDMDIDNSYIDSDVTFMIGIGFQHLKNKIDTRLIINGLEIDRSKCMFYHVYDKDWEYVCLYLPKFKLENELEMYRIFFQFMIIRQDLISKAHPEINSVSRAFHWTDAEIRFLERSVQRIIAKDPSQRKLIDQFNTDIVWVDLCKIFQQDPIVVKGCFRYKLKHIANAMYSHGLITTHWSDGEMSDGFRAMLEAIKLYRTDDILSITNKLYKDIVDYNEVDCKVMWDIVRYLRANHVK